VPSLSLKTVGRIVRVECEDADTWTLLTATYGRMRADLAPADLRYTVGRRPAGGGFFIERDGRELATVSDDGGFLARFDEDFAIEVQKLRPEIYFVHAAVLTPSDGAFMLVTESGGGKSTLCWALAHHGYRVLSDELAPIELGALDVHPFARALMLKTAPPGAHYPIPATALRSSRGWHVAAGDVPSGLGAGSTRLTAIFFLRRDAAASGPAVRAVGAAEAAARLYANSLNQLAHQGDGLDAAIRIATDAATFELVTTADLPTVCRRVIDTLQALAARSAPSQLS
jgi:hypothetical protein